MSWELANLQEVTSKIGDGLHGTPKYDKNGEYYFINGNNLRQGRVQIKEDTKKIDFQQYQKIKKELNNQTIFVAINGTLGNTGVYNGEKIALGKSTCYLNINQNVEKLFIRYVLEDRTFQSYAQRFATGATIKNLGLKAIRNYEFLLPPLQTQKRISDILSAYDDLIENNLKRIKLLEQAAQNIYKEWFVNMRFPGHENTPINEETGLPVGWEDSELDSVATVQSSKRVFLADYVDNGVPFYRGKEISQKVKHEAVSEPYFISHEKFREFDSGFGSPKENDILITAVGTIGNCYLVRNSDLPFYFKDGNLLWIHSYNETVSGFYLIQYFQSPIFKGVLNSITIGSSQKALTIKAVKKLNITVPNNEILEKFDSIIKPTMNQIEVLAKTTTQLKAARDILLPRLMNRTIEV